MKTPRFLLLMLVTVLALLTPHRAEARHETSFDFFYDSLSPYGEWVQVADYGYCWRPTDVDPDWAPYADGYWAFTDAGWTWVSYEDFGGIVYHYGRWVRVEDAGWCWVPEYEWGPAWVSWRHNDDYVGWAPLPPEARWHSTIGFSTWVDRDYDIGPSYYSFCRVRDFGAPVLRPVIIDRFENVTLIRRTVNITNITYNTRYGAEPIVYNGGPSFALINQRSARPIPALKLVQNTNIDLAGLRDGPRGDHRRNFNGQAVGNQLIVTAPFVKPPVDPQFLQPKVSKVFAADKVNRGWNGVKDEGVRQELRQEVQRQTKGLTRDTAPARAVVANDLKVLPEKADPQAPSPVAGHDRPDKKGRTSEVTGQPSGPNAGQQGTPKSGPTAVVPPVTDEKPFQGKGRGPMSKDSQKPVAGDSNLKPFNPATETDQKPRKNNPPGTFAPPDAGNAERQAEINRQRQEGQAAAKQQAEAQQRQAEILRQRQEGQAAAKQQQQADALRQQQQAEAAAAGRQRMQGEQGRGPRQQGDGAFTEQQQKKGGGGGGQQNQAAMEQQRAQREANEQARRSAQEGQGQGQGQRPRTETQQRPPQPQQQQQRVGPPGSPGATPTDGKKKKDKDNQ